MNPGDIVHYWGEHILTKDINLWTTHRWGWFVREVARGKKKGKLVIKHGGRMVDPWTETIDNEQVIG